MNNDIEIVQSDFISRIEFAYQDSNFDILGPDVVTVGKQVHQNPQALNNYSLQQLRKLEIVLLVKNSLKFLYWFRWNIFGRLSVGKRTPRGSNKKVSERIFGRPLHGSFYVFSKKFIQNNDECFYNGTFMYMESYILHYIATKKNYKLVYEPSIVVKHYDDVATNLRFKDRYSKAIFSNKEMLKSTKIFINLMKNDEKN